MSELNHHIMQKKHLEGLAHLLIDRKATGNKPALQKLLTNRFGTITRDQFTSITATVQRGLAVAMLPAAATAVPQLPSPAETPPEQPPALLPPAEDDTGRISDRLKRRRLK